MTEENFAQGRLPSFGRSDFMPLVRASEDVAGLIARIIRRQSAHNRSGRTAPNPGTVSPNAIIRAAAGTLVLFVICDTVARAFGVPFPGAAIGMLLLLAIFNLSGGPDAGSERLFDAIAPHIPLFFVPAATGIIANLDSFGRAWTSIAIAIVAGTALTLAVTGRLMQAMLARRPKGAHG